MSAQRVALAASVDCADPLRLGEVAAALEREGVDRLHVDMMDGRFVPNLAAGFNLVTALCRLALPVEVHVMTLEPERFLPRLAAARAEVVIVHVETLADPARTVAGARALGLEIGLAFNPRTPFDELEDLLPEVDQVVVMGVEPGFSGRPMLRGTLERVARVRRIAEDLAYEGMLEVDGGVTWTAACALRDAGATGLVAGSQTLFRPGHDPAAAVRRLRRLVDEPERQPWPHLEPGRRRQSAFGTRAH